MMGWTVIQARSFNERKSAIQTPDQSGAYEYRAKNVGEL